VLSVERADGGEGLLAGDGLHAVGMMPEAHMRRPRQHRRRRRGDCRQPANQSSSRTASIASQVIGAVKAAMVSDERQTGNDACSTSSPTSWTATMTVRSPPPIVAPIHNMAANGQ